MASQWSPQETERFLHYARHCLNEEERASFEKRIRDGTEHATSESLATYKDGRGFQKSKEGDIIGESIDEIWSDDRKMMEVIQEALENAAASYERVKAKGIQDGLKLPREMDMQLLSTSWKQSYMKSLTKACINNLRIICSKLSKEGHLCAISEKEYSSLEPSVIASLMKDGMASVERYVGTDFAAITREMDFMQFNGAFNMIQDTSSVYEGCSIMWLKNDHLSPKHQKETSKAMERLTSLPYELCKKCKLMLQVMPFLRVILMSPLKSKIKQHKDSLEAGVMFSLLYIASIRSEEFVHVKMDVSGNRREIKLESDQLILFRGDLSYEIESFPGKMFIMSGMITGAKS